MYEFVTAALTNAHKRRGLNNAGLLSHSSIGQKPNPGLTRLKQSVGRLSVFPEAPGENLFPFLFQTQEAAAPLGLWPLSSMFKASSGRSRSHVTSLADFSASLFCF